MTVVRTSIGVAVSALLIAGCLARPESGVDDRVRTGADMLVSSGFEELRGQRVGLITNHTARVGNTHLADLMVASSDVQLVALFGPEHGIRGNADAGQIVGDAVDPSTEVPVFSLYGENRAPTSEMLGNVDALVFDIQDVGARFYTYISTMGRSMQSAAAKGIPFYVLDRPNPLSGEYVAGFVLEPAHRSFVGEYPIPVAHGMTVGELAKMIQGERMMDGLDSLELRVIGMDGWTRSMQWPETGLDWVGPSPNIPSFETALVYPGACFVEATEASEGRGTKRPFITIGAPWGAHLAAEMNRRGLPGVRFDKVVFTPESIPGMSTNPKLLGQRLEGLVYQIRDRRAFRPVETGIHLLDALVTAYGEHGTGEEPLVRERSLLRLAGTRRLAEMLERRQAPEDIIAGWQREVEAFRQRREPYLLYP